MGVSSSIYSLPLQEHEWASVEQGEIFFLAPRKPWSRIGAGTFHGERVRTVRRLSAREMAPVIKLLSMKDVYLGAPDKSSAPVLGVRVQSPSGFLDALFSFEGRWVRFFKGGNDWVMPLERHSVYLLRTIVETSLKGAVARSQSQPARREYL